MRQIVFLLAGIFLISNPVLAVTQEDDLLEKGPFELRFSPRILGKEIIQSQFNKSVDNHDEHILFDANNGNSNQIIISIDAGQTGRISQLLGIPLPEVSLLSRPAIERRLIQSAQAKSLDIWKVMGFPSQVVYLFNNDRASDESRIQGELKGAISARLERYIVLTYSSIDAALLAETSLRSEKMISTIGMNKTDIRLSFAPNDPYFLPPANMDIRKYQWGLSAMNFPQAWDVVKGNAYIGIMDFGPLGVTQGANGAATVTVHADLINRFRPQLSPGVPYYTSATHSSISSSSHSIHVAGIVAAQPDNAIGVSGGCLNCALGNFPFMNSTFLGPANVQSLATAIVAFRAAIDAGMQILNWSGNIGQPTCTSMQALCDVFDLATEHDVLIVEATGNFNSTTLNEPMVSLSRFPTLPVGGTGRSDPQIGTPNSRWLVDPPVSGNSGNGSAWPGMSGVLAPAKSVVSTFRPVQYLNYYYALCGDSNQLSTTGINFPVAVPTDESGDRFSNGYGDGYASCTGTSMAAPHISSLAGLIRSVNPLLSVDQVRLLIRQSGNLFSNLTAEYGSGLPNAFGAVTNAVATNPSRLTPLFSFWSDARSDSFYTTVPQMANSAIDGTLFPRKPNPATVGLYNGGSYNSPDYFSTNGQLFGTYSSSYGPAITSYPAFPRNPFVIGGSSTNPRAEVWVFTTDKNPKSTTVFLEPLIRMSWKCGDPPASTTPAICSTNSFHTETVLVNTTEQAYFKSIGYKTDGIEGYIYPKSLPQPAGTVKLMRKYNPAKDDHAIFPDTAIPSMTALGYTATTNTNDWLGYVYRNINGSMPAIQ